MQAKEKENFERLFSRGEDFFDRYENLLMIELAQFDFTINETKNNYRLNTRCFSCNLIYNKMPLRWRVRYNEDVILSTDIMVSGYCIASFHGGALKAKMSTRSAVGGNHATKKGDCESLYQDGFDYLHSSEAKTNLLLNVYPKYFKKVIKYGRIHHEYNRTALREITSNKLIDAKIYGQKKINMLNFLKVKHYKLPE